MQNTIQIKPKFLYDADCGICEIGIGSIREKVQPPVEIMPYQTFDYENYGVTLKDLNSGPIFIDENKKIFVGPLAMSQMFMRSRNPYRTIGIVMWLPGIRNLLKKIGPVMYRNRGYLPGATDACRIEKI
jgi:hypothetical protein